MPFAPPPTAPPFLCSHMDNGRGDSEDLQEAHVLHQHHVLHQDVLHQAADDAAREGQHLSNAVMHLSYAPPPPTSHDTHPPPQQHDSSNSTQHSRNSAQHMTHAPPPNTTHPPPLCVAPICHKKRANPASYKALHPRGHLLMSSGGEMQEDDTKTIPIHTTPTATAPLASDSPHHFQESGGRRGTVGVFWHCGWLGCVSAPAGYGHASAANAVHGFASRYGHVDAVRELHPSDSSLDDAVGYEHGDKESVTMSHLSRARSQTSKPDKTSEGDMAAQMVEEILTWLWDHSSRQSPHDSSRLSPDAAHGCGGNADGGHTSESDGGCSRSLRLAAGYAVEGGGAGGGEALTCAHTGNGSMTVTVAPPVAPRYHQRPWS